MSRLKRTGVASTVAARGLVAVAALAVAGSVVYGQNAPPKAAPKPTSTAPASGTSTITGPPNALQGFSQNRDQPIQIDAARLEVRDKDKVATFYGDEKADVKVIQGDTTMRSKVLVVFYDQENQPGAKAAPKAAKAAAPGPGGSSSIRRLEAKGNVIVTQKDQTVTGDNGVFDMKTNKVTMMGNVVLTGGDNVLLGDRLVVDMTTSVSQVEVAPGGRVKGLFKSSPQANDASKPGAAPASGKSSGPFGGVLGGSR
jgi:lipopolysaccharide export system protein LptA